MWFPEHKPSCTAGPHVRAARSDALLRLNLLLQLLTQPGQGAGSVSGGACVGSHGSGPSTMHTTRQVHGPTSVRMQGRAPGCWWAWRRREERGGRLADGQRRGRAQVAGVTSEPSEGGGRGMCCNQGRGAGHRRARPKGVRNTHFFASRFRCRMVSVSRRVLGVSRSMTRYWPPHPAHPPDATCTTRTISPIDQQGHNGEQRGVRKSSAPILETDRPPPPATLPIVSFPSPLG